MRGISTVSIRLLADYTTQYTSARIGLNAATLFILLYAPPGFTARRDKSIENARKLSEYVPPNYYTRQEKVTQNVFKCLRYVLPGPTILRGRSIQDIIKWSQYLLVFWFILSIPDQVMHSKGREVTYGHIIYHFFFSLIRVTSDTLMIAGAFVATQKQCYGRVKHAMGFLLVGDMLILVVAVSGLLYLVYTLAFYVTWLQVGDPQTIMNLYHLKDIFETAFAAMQCVLATLNYAAAVECARAWANEQSKATLNYAKILCVANSALWGRTVSELVFVIHYGLWGKPTVPYTALARDVVFDVCTIASFILGSFAHKRLWRTVHRHPVLAKMEYEFHSYIIQKIKDAKASGNDPPPLRSLFRALHQDDGGPFGILSSGLITELRGIKPAWIQLRVERQFEEYIRQCEQEIGAWKYTDPARVS